MKFFVLKAVNPNFQRKRVWVAPKERVATDPDGMVMCKDVLTARLVSTSGFKLVINPLLGKHGIALRKEGSLPVSRTEAAKLLGVTAMVVDTWERAGKLKGYYLRNNGPLFSHDEVAQLAKSREQSGQTTK
jgi:hypothetical protein